MGRRRHWSSFGGGARPDLLVPWSPDLLTYGRFWQRMGSLIAAALALEYPWFWTLQLLYVMDYSATLRNVVEALFLNGVSPFLHGHCGVREPRRPRHLQGHSGQGRCRVDCGVSPDLRPSEQAGGAGGGGCQGNPCSTGIRWGVSPAAQMGCLRNRSGSPSGADRP